MNGIKRRKTWLIIFLSAAMGLSAGSSAYAAAQSFPNRTIVTQYGTKYLTDSNGEKYSGWFLDASGDWYYFKETDQAMKTGWFYNNADGYQYYLNLSDGKMVTGWQTIDGKEYFFQPVRDMGNYRFDQVQETWLYSDNGKIPYGAMYADTAAPDGSRVDSHGVKMAEKASVFHDAGLSDAELSNYIGTFRTELGHAGEGSEEFALSIKKIENHKLWGACSSGGIFSKGYGEWDGAPIIGHKVPGTFYYDFVTPASDQDQFENDFHKENFNLYFEDGALYIDLNTLTGGDKLKLVRDYAYPNDGYRQQEYKASLIEGNH